MERVYKRISILPLLLAICLVVSGFRFRDARTYYEEGLVNLQAREYVQAIGDFTLAISLKPDFAEAYLQRAIAKQLLGEKMGFVNSERCVDLAQALSLGHEEAAHLLMNDCRGEGYSPNSPIENPQEEFCFGYSNRHLSVLPQSIELFPHLVSLNFAHNELKAIDQRALSGPQLMLLDVSHNQLSSVSSSVGQLAYLQELNLNNNRLTALPAEIGNLHRLKALFLRGNQLRHVPASITGCQSLEMLDLSFNQLTELPEEINRLSRLEHLILVGNKISKEAQQSIQKALPQCHIEFE